jgi:hypothetical protein
MRRAEDSHICPPHAIVGYCFPLIIAFLLGRNSLERVSFVSPAQAETAAQTNVPGGTPGTARRLLPLLLAVVAGAKRLLVAVPLVLVPVLIFGVFNEAIKVIPDPTRRAELKFDSTFLFGDAFRAHLSEIASNWPLIVGLFVALSAVACWIKLLVAGSIVSAIANRRADVFHNATSIGLGKVARHVVLLAALISTYLVAAAALYLALNHLHRHGLPSAHYGFAIFILVLPLHIGLQSIYGLILIISSDISHEMRLVRLAARPKNLARLYAFLALRLSIEAVIVLVAYFLLRRVIPESALIAAGIVALLIPFAFMRASSALYELTLLANDPVAQQLVAKSLTDRAAREE